MHKGIFITGTDTGVGKTYVAEGVIRALRKMGFGVCPLKPVETGCGVSGGRLVPHDAIALLRASEAGEPVDAVNPYRFRKALAPSVAAGLEGKEIKISNILTAYKSLSRKYDVTVVEGAGGIAVPVYKDYLFLDLVDDLNLAVIIVARPGLGTINHTLLTVSALKSRRIKILGVVINYSTGCRKGISEKTNPRIISRLGGVSLLATVPYSKRRTASGKIFRVIAGRIIGG